MRIFLILFGGLLAILHNFIFRIPVEVQFFALAIGVLVIGIPHGAADLLVANHDSTLSKKRFSILFFFVDYLLRLTLFAAILWFFPFVGMLLFMLFAAFHFGETDLFDLPVKSIQGQLLFVSYGLLILSVIILQNFDEVKPILFTFPSGVENAAAINWVGGHTLSLTFFFGFVFCMSVLFYFGKNQRKEAKDLSFTAAQSVLLLIILSKLPMLLGFAFYFVLWHSSLSLQNIWNFIKSGGPSFSAAKVFAQVFMFSFLAIAGILLFGYSGVMFHSNNAVLAYSFIGLAVLTAPHMHIMHRMYGHIR